LGLFHREEVCMRRTDKEITERALMSQIIESSQVCRLGLAKDNLPYILPVSFGYDGNAIFFHTAKEGRKIVFLAANNRVCFEFEHDVQLVRHDSNPCKWTFSFQSVIGYGSVWELTDAAEKIEGLNHIMRHYSGRAWPIEAKDTDDLRVWRLTIENLTGKQSKDKFDARWMA
jgi:nitroimidazol reductase NimA-like FMN-containing flavoprotein (pyridoxamine 5'-phosphate oxidase superfamily)